ncbi:hypothetical protein BK140_09090 [Paenibacillus macerans]|nr:hypothetical protein BK140_09090 [Paenibacillus macerans]
MRGAGNEKNFLIFLVAQPRNRGLTAGYWNGEPFVGRLPVAGTADRSSANHRLLERLTVRRPTTGYWNGQPTGRPSANHRLLEQPTAGLQNSGTLCTYYPGLSMFIPISGIFCSYFPMNGPDFRYFVTVRENSDINFLYFLKLTNLAGITTFFVLIFLSSFLFVFTGGELIK